MFCCMRKQQNTDEEQSVSEAEQVGELENMMAGETRSSLKRKEGNAMLSTATDNLSPIIRLGRLEQALGYYREAYKCANDDDERSSAAKNTGVVQWKIARTSAQAGGSDWVYIKYRFKEALSYFNMAYRTGVACYKPTHWTDNILASCRGCWEELSALVESQLSANSMEAHFEKIVTIREFIDYLPIPDMKADCFMEIADFHFHRGIAALANEDYKTSITHLRECHFPMHEAVRYSGGEHRVQRQFDVLESDIVMQIGLAQSIQSRAIGDQLFDKVVMDTEVLNTDMIWEVIDWYKDSILKVRGLDVKHEAMSLSRIGLVYEKILKIRFRAKEYLKNALELAQAITPMNVTNEKWYQDTVAILEQFQKETIMHEQEEDKKRKASVKEEIKPQLDLINEHSIKDSNVALLRFVYSTFKPKNPEHKLDLPEDDKEPQNMEKEYKWLQMAVIHYHPDRVREEEHGLKLKVLYEEITKVLTNRYQNIKLAK